MMSDVNPEKIPTITLTELYRQVNAARAEENECLTCGKHTAVCCADCYSKDIKAARAEEKKKVIARMEKEISGIKPFEAKRHETLNTLFKEVATKALDAVSSK